MQLKDLKFKETHYRSAETKIASYRTFIHQNLITGKYNISTIGKTVEAINIPEILTEDQVISILQKNSISYLKTFLTAKS